MSAAATARQEAPFIGLHYFDETSEDLFFGRDEQVRDLLAKLAASRFVTVIGSSGTGKSSLARAGLIPAIKAGFLTAFGPEWRIFTTHPGGSPIANLASAMEAVFATSGLELTLRRGPLGLIEAARQSGLRGNTNMLVIVDQFEEIFRYQREAKDRETAAAESISFIKLLLEAAKCAEPAIFVLLTMRSDYLGACAQFRDLPERINVGLYLIPRMRRDQLEDAIVGPAAVDGARFSPPLVQKLLNDAGEDPDQLSVLQHALLRTWMNWKALNPDEEPSAKEIGFGDYESTGGVFSGLDRHAEEIYLSLNGEERRLAEILFRCLTERDPSNNDIRRPTTIGVIAAVAGVGTDDVCRVANRFRGEGVSFLTPSAPAILKAETPLDITHESLIRKWRRLGASGESKGWVQTEAELREQYRYLVKRARRAHPNSEVLTGTDLEDGLTWRDHCLTAAWALRYEPAGDAFSLVSEYIKRSGEAHNRELAEAELRRRWQRISGYLTVLFALGFVAVTFSRNAMAHWILDSIGISRMAGGRLKKWSTEGFAATLVWAPYVATYLLVTTYGKQVLRRISYRTILEEVAAKARNRNSERHADSGRAAATPELIYAGFGRRLTAYLIDLIVFTGEILACMALSDDLDSMNWTDPNSVWFMWVAFAMDWIYQTWTISSRRQATLGMMATGIVATDIRGGRLSFARASARHFAKILSYYSVVGMFLPLWLEKKQALHDVIMRTVVARRRGAKPTI
jgi:uncharacterized RDD family membrane protein YckC/energy-coupling factor transporter ATP-binding protein EcfA2